MREQERVMVPIQRALNLARHRYDSKFPLSLLVYFQHLVAFGGRSFGSRCFGNLRVHLVSHHLLTRHSRIESRLAKDDINR